MANENVIHLNDSTFSDQIQSGYTLVDFWADWCAPCHALSPTIDKIADKYKGQLKVSKVNADENHETMARYGVRGLPTVLLFKDGEQVDMVVGNAPAQVEKVVSSHIN